MQFSLRTLFLACTAIALAAACAGPILYDSLRDWLATAKPIYENNEMSGWVEEWEETWSGDKPFPAQEKRVVDAL